MLCAQHASRYVSDVLRFPLFDVPFSEFIHSFIHHSFIRSFVPSFLPSFIHSFSLPVFLAVCLFFSFVNVSLPPSLALCLSRTPAHTNIHTRTRAVFTAAPLCARTSLLLFLCIFNLAARLPSDVHFRLKNSDFGLTHNAVRSSSLTHATVTTRHSPTRQRKVDAPYTEQQVEGDRGELGAH